MILGFILSAAVIAVDQLTKFLIYGIQSKSIIGNLLWFESSLNTGVAFSMFEGKSYIFITTSILASAVFVWLIASKKFFNTRYEKITLGIILGGTLGNVIDRIVFNGVRDFIYLKFINFAIFNVADMAITLGAIALCVYEIIVSLKKEKSKEEKND